MSMPAETPAAVMILPRSTTRSSVGQSSWSMASQWVVAATPSSSPAAERISAPVQTDVVKRDVSCAARIQSSTRRSRAASRDPIPPGTTTTSGRGTSSKLDSTTTGSIRVSVRTTPGSAAMNSTCASGSRDRTSYGPTASSAVKRSYSGIAICMVFLSGLEPAAVVGRAHAEPAMEGAAHRLDGAEAAVARHGLDLLAARLEPHAGVVHAQRLDVGAWRHAHLACEGPGEVARAHAGALGERRHGQIGVEVRGHPFLEVPQRLALGDLRPEMRAELRLAAGAADEEHEPAGGLERHLAPEVLLDQREGQVHPGGHAGRRPHAAVVDE